MAKQTTEQTVGLCREAMTNVRNAYDRGYKQGFKDGKTETVTSSFEKGLNDAWEIARKIAKARSMDKEMNEIYEIFGDDFYYMSLSAFFENYSIQEVMSKIKEYEENQKCKNCGHYPEKGISSNAICIKCENNNMYIEKQKKPAKEEFKVGDEVIADERRFVVLGIDDFKWYQLWCLDNGLAHDNICSKDLKKTGRSFPQLAELFKQMKEE
jgi:hypothetical protein